MISQQLPQYTSRLLSTVQDYGARLAADTLVHIVLSLYSFGRLSRRVDGAEHCRHGQSDTWKGHDRVRGRKKCTNGERSELAFRAQIVKEGTLCRTEIRERPRASFTSFVD